MGARELSAVSYKLQMNIFNKNNRTKIFKLDMLVFGSPESKPTIHPHGHMGGGAQFDVNWTRSLQTY